MWARSQTIGDISSECCRQRSSSLTGATSSSVRRRASSSSVAILAFKAGRATAMVGISNVFRAPYHPRAVKSVLLIAPSKRDLAAAARARYRVSGVGDDLDEAPDLDPRRLVAEAEQFVTDGVVGTKDRSALLAALVAERLGLAGPPPAGGLRWPTKVPPPPRRE